ncbi:MAG: ribosomal-protein-alanine acetyltransferase [Acidobacteria bacterium]|jgi:ribosomal-protein-alanine N-acetyltransferase|nr:ribosomal-protein-alanine acetyltransferase [Acidobacteriota bacterium]
MIIREMHREIDGEQLADFDASFSTERIYRVSVENLSVAIAEEKLAAPLYKTYPLDSIVKDIDEADYGVVAEIDEKIAGFALVKYEAWNNRARLTGIFVRANSKGKGVGRALIEAATNFAKGKKARCLFVETQNVNYPAIQFYRKSGFEFCGFDSALYNPEDISGGETAFYLRKNLTFMKILETERTTLREITENDAAFILDLMNQPSFIKYIGDRDVRTIDAARREIENRFLKSYTESGFGFWAVELKDSNTPIGICGFVKRETLPEPDVGFAFLPQFERKGYAYEAALAVMKYGREKLNLQRVLAITTRENERSVKLLEKLGLSFVRLIAMPHEKEELKLFSSDLSDR